MKRFFPIAILCALLALIVIGLGLMLRSGDRKNEIVLYGNVDVREVDIGFRVSGQVCQLFFEEGDFVPKGSLMATLIKTPYDERVQQAEANLESVLANCKNAEILLQRRKELIGVGGVSLEELDNAQANRDALQGQFLSGEAALQIARDDLSYTFAYAPNDGILLTRIREPGTVVREADPVYTLSLSSPIWIRAYVAEPDLGKVDYGMEAKVYTDTKGGRVYYGKVGFISPVAEFTPKTVETTKLRTDLVYRLRIYAENPDQGLKQGMPVTVKLKTRISDD
jgi:HlyD family secretion protein